MSRVIRLDRGIALAAPRWTGNGKVLEGVAGRTHSRGDGLSYGGHEEYRGPAETKSIAMQLARGDVPFTVKHPSSMPARNDKSAWIAGVVIGGRFDDGEHVIATVRVDDPRAIALIDSGHRELSLGYACDVDANHYQQNIRIDHLALVAAARCGATCALRSDSSKGKAMSDCGCKDKTDQNQDPELAARERMNQRRVDANGTRFASVSGTGSTFADEVRAATGAFDVPADAIAQMAMAARTANQFVIDDADRDARIRVHVINSIKKLQESGK